MTLSADEFQLLAYLLLAFAGAVTPILAVAGAGRVAAIVSGSATSIAAVCGILGILRAEGHL